ncbi:alpha/beta fold hydrolase [Tomitella biformata]|uniref:alpha/beta fold hydrolase n=1 Tax=Tomitella biformata TaxID=630403 RepID=UPI0004646ABF|nr:alpha/beta hydrolase [Tomitella biformata]
MTDVADGVVGSAQVGSVQVEGAAIHYRVRGRGGRDLILVHGHLAHDWWWHAVAPILERDWRVVTVDLSGHGDSGHRAEYSVAQWSREVAKVLDAVDSSDAVLVGHSLGGSVTIAAAANHAERVCGLVLMDTYIVGQGSELPQIPRGRRRVYGSRAEALARFRVLPPQPAPAAEFMAPIAENSLRPVEGGWTWKFDNVSPLIVDYDFVSDCIARLAVPTRYVYAEHSAVVTATVLANVRESFPAATAMSMVVGAHHHLILERPAECAELISAAARQMAVG